MANGILKSQSEYYNDPLKYTGTIGTKTNMYVIEDAYDLCATTSIGTYGRDCELVADIDFNDHEEYRYGITNTVFGISTATSYLYGNKHKIRNLIIKNDNVSAVFYAGLIQDVIFENLILMNSVDVKLFHSSYAPCNIINTHIGCHLFNSASKCLMYVYSSSEPLNFTDCTFNIRGLSTDSLNLNSSYVYMLRCHINLDIETSNYNGIHAQSGAATIDNTYITGKIVQTINSGAANYAARNLNMINSYIAVSVSCSESDYADGILLYNVKSTAVSFIVEDLIHDFRRADVDNLYYLTTEQATDPDYLLSINFPVVPID